MPDQNRKVKPGFKIGTVIAESGEVLTPPANWEFLPAGDGPLTRNVKKRGFSWQVQVKRGRRTISKGLWVKAEHINNARAELESKRSAPDYARKRAADKARRDRKHAEYVDEFYRATLNFLDFHPDYKELAERLARSVTVHATPVGSGTVARTERIPLEERSKAAVIAWMRHKTTAYDSMSIARVKGRRREVRRNLAEKSLRLLTTYRKGIRPVANCPLQSALQAEMTEQNSD